MTGLGAGFWLRWSGRDLRARRLQVGAIAVVIGLGVGTYAGLGSTSAWRRASNDASYAALRMHDLRVSLPPGVYLPAAGLVDAARSIPAAGAVTAAEARLVTPAQLDASGSGRTVLVPGRVVGVPLEGPGAGHLDRIRAREGRTLRTLDADRAVAVVHATFAEAAGLAPGGTVRLSGGREVRVVGTGLSPPDFLVLDDRGGLTGRAGFAVLYVPIRFAQRLVARPGVANEVVLGLRPGTDPHRVGAQVRRAVTARFGPTALTVTPRERERSLRVLYDDIEGDRRFYTVFALLILAGAAFAAFNLTGRIVAAQRRELGIGMALGVPPARLAVRPLLVAAQVAVAGALAGLAIGALISRLMAQVIGRLLFLPEWRYPVDAGVWGRGLVAGVVLPFVAAALPVRRVLRVTPVEAIRRLPVDAPGRGIPLLGRLRLPGRSLAQMPVRNLARAPRRTLMTAMGIGAAITVLVGVLGMVDSFDATIDRAETELLHTAPRRLLVQLDTFLPAGEVRTRLADPTVAVVEPRLRLPATVRSQDRRLDVFIDVLPARGALWRPRVSAPAPPGGRPGIVLTRRAAASLRVRPGDVLVLRHPRRVGLGYRFTTTRVRLVGVSELPLRPVAFMGAPDARIMALEGIANAASVQPAPGVRVSTVQRALFGRAGIGTVEPVAALTNDIRRELDRVLGLLVIVQGAVLLLALMIAFNSVSITTDERRRDHATMFAFGLPVRTVVALVTVESLLVGCLGTVAGVVAGRVLVGQLIGRVVTDTFPDLGLVAAVAPSTVGLAFTLGVAAVAVAPLLMARRLVRMDIPGTLRVVE